MSTANKTSWKTGIVVLAGVLASVFVGGCFYARAEDGWKGVSAYGQLSVRD